MLKFWYVACGPCRQEIPSLNALVEEFSGQPVVFLGFALDGPEKLRAFLEEMPYRYQVVPNAEPIIEAFGGATYYPTHVVIDTRGTIVHFASGGGLDTHSVLRPIIRAALARRLVGRRAAGRPAEQEQQMNAMILFLLAGLICLRRRLPARSQSGTRRSPRPRMPVGSCRFSTRGASRTPATATS